MGRSAIALTTRVTLSTAVHALSGCLGAFIVRDGLGVLGGIGLLTVAANA